MLMRGVSGLSVGLGLDASAGGVTVSAGRGAGRAAAGPLVTGTRTVGDIMWNASVVSGQGGDREKNKLVINIDRINKYIDTSKRARSSDRVAIWRSHSTLHYTEGPQPAQ